MSLGEELSLPHSEAARSRLVGIITGLRTHGVKSVSRRANDCLARIKAGELRLISASLQNPDRPVRFSLRASQDATSPPLVTPVLEFDTELHQPDWVTRQGMGLLVSEMAVAATAPTYGYQNGLRDVYRGAIEITGEWWTDQPEYRLPDSQLFDYVAPAIGEANFMTNIGYPHWQVVVAEHLRNPNLDPRFCTWLNRAAANKPLSFLRARVLYTESAYAVLVQEFAGRIAHMESDVVSNRATDILLNEAYGREERG